MDSEWALNPVVRRDVAVSELLASLGGNVFPERRKLLVDLLDIDENWHMHAVSDGPPSPLGVPSRIPRLLFLHPIHPSPIYLTGVLHFSEFPNCFPKFIMNAH